MWRSQARRAFLCRRAAAPESLEPIARSQESLSHETLTATLPSDESAFRFSLFSWWVSAKFRSYQSPRFFSGKTSENNENSPFETLIAKANDVTKSNSTNVLYENKNVDSVVEGADNFGKIFDGAMDEKLVSGSAVTEGWRDERVKENDPAKVKSLRSYFENTYDNGAVLESKLEEMDLFLNEDFVLKIINSYFNRERVRIDFTRWALKKLDFKVTARVLDELVTATCYRYVKEAAYICWKLVEEVGEKGTRVITTRGLNKLITHFSREGMEKVAIEVFNKFEAFGCLQNADSYYFAFECFCAKFRFDEACSVCEKMLNAGELQHDGERVGYIINSLCRGEKAKGAHMVYLYAKAKGAHVVYLPAKDKKFYISLQSFDTLICSLSRIKSSYEEIDKEHEKETVFLALEMLDDYPAVYRICAIRPFSSVLKKLCWIEDFGSAKKLLLKMIDARPSPVNANFNCLINGLSKVGDMDEALEIKKMMENRGLKPDACTYDSIIKGYSKDGAMEEANKIFDEAKTKHSKPSRVTFNTLISGFCKLKQFDKAVKLLGEMKQCGVHPNHDEYNKLIKSLCLKALILDDKTKALISTVKELKRSSTT